jgi:hypothetical protein
METAIKKQLFAKKAPIHSPLELKLPSEIKRA